MDWERYKALDAERHRIARETPVTVTFTYDEFQEAKYGMMLLRRWPDMRSDLERVNDHVSPLVGKVYDAFASIPGVRSLREEQMRMLKERSAATPPAERQPGPPPVDHEKGESDGIT